MFENIKKHGVHLQTLKLMSLREVAGGIIIGILAEN